MAGNENLIPLEEKPWRRGLKNLLDAGLKSWFGTHTWWVQSLIWTGITLMLLTGFILGDADRESFSNFIIFSLVIGLFAPIAVVIITQDAIVGEKKSGTAAWILSKPVTPIAFILSKFISNLLGMLCTMVLIPGAAGYILIGALTGDLPQPGGFLAGLAVLGLNITFFLTLSLMLGALFDHPAAVIAIPLGFQFGQQFILGALGKAAVFMPWTLSLPINGESHGVASALMAGLPVPSWGPVILVAVLTVLCFIISVVKFADQEF